MKTIERLESRLVKNLFRLITACAASFLLAPTGRCASLVVLPSAISYEYFGLNFASNIATSNAVGTLTYTGSPGCAPSGTCVATTQLGIDPSVSLSVWEVPYQNTVGGVADSWLGYYVEYVNPAPGTYSVNVHAPENLSIPDSAPASAYLAFGPAGGSPGSFNDFQSTTFQEAACVNGCPPPGFAFTAVGIPVDQAVQMIANTPYFLVMELSFRPDGNGGQESGYIDPQFSTTASGGFFAFSSGVVDPAAVPEPGAIGLVMMGTILNIGLARFRRLNA